jgi:hypothetical protein
LLTEVPQNLMGQCSPDPRLVDINIGTFYRCDRGNIFLGVADSTGICSHMLIEIFNCAV